MLRGRSRRLARGLRRGGPAGGLVVGVAIVGLLAAGGCSISESAAVGIPSAPPSGEGVNLPGAVDGSGAFVGPAGGPAGPRPSFGPTVVATVPPPPLSG